MQCVVNNTFCFLFFELYLHSDLKLRIPFGNDMANRSKLYVSYKKSSMVMKRLCTFCIGLYYGFEIRIDHCVSIMQQLPFCLLTENNCLLYSLTHTKNELNEIGPLAFFFNILCFFFFQESGIESIIMSVAIPEDERPNICFYKCISVL